jgi:hypothetical protein
MQKVTSVEHAEQITGLTLKWELFKELGLAPEDVDAAIADQQIKLIIKANNILNNWEAKYEGEDRYSPWLLIIEKLENASGRGFAFDVAAYWAAGTLVGARLEVGTAEECEYNTTGTDKASA